jgi:hypothetical protein
MQSQQNAPWIWTTILKSAAASLPLVIAGAVNEHRRTVIALCMVLGAILQGLIPPRERFLRVLVVVSIFALIYALGGFAWLFR